MTNKRQIKKYIDRLCGDVAQVVLPAAMYAKAINETKAEELLNEISTLKTRTIARMNISFDKAPEAFDSMRAYNAAKVAYFRQAYNKAIEDFEKGVQDIIRPVNEGFTKK